MEAHRKPVWIQPDEAPYGLARGYTHDPDGFDISIMSVADHEITRRSFLLELGTAIVAAAIPSIGFTDLPVRVMPRVVLNVQQEEYASFTASFFL